ncbi:MAG: hypothetical protein GQ559_03955 [Desulfobulbaceae bacterium]|nr:hypothetical protein [Desulfobulbaceae bacterium]
MSYTIQQKAGKLNHWFLLLLAFSLPLSTSVMSVAGVLIAICWLVEGEYRGKLLEIVNNPVSIAVLVYLSLFVIGLLWTENLGTGLDMLENRWKLLLMPVFLTAIRYEKRRVYIVSFLAGMTIAMLLTYIAWFGWLQYADVSSEHLTRKTFHVVYNPMLAFAIYLLVHEIIWGSVRGWWRWAAGIIAVLMIFDMFITEGRTGQLVFFVLFALLLLQLYRKNILRGFIITVLLLPTLFAVGYLLSPTFHDRIEQARFEAAEFRNNPETSVGFRLLYWQNSWEIIKGAPLFGVGTGDFQSAYAEVNSRLSPKVKPTDNPHNQYVLILCQFGLLGLSALLGIFIVQMHQAGKMRDGWQRMRVAFPLFFLTIMLTESYLVVYETGFLFSLFSAVLYKNKATGPPVGNGCSPLPPAGNSV